MTDTVRHAKLTHAGALKMIEAAIAKATEINVPQCITVTGDGDRFTFLGGRGVDDYQRIARHGL